MNHYLEKYLIMETAICGGPAAQYPARVYPMGYEDIQSAKNACKFYARDNGHYTYSVIERLYEATLKDGVASLDVVS